jgi:geranylgeranyl reductase family
MRSMDRYKWQCPIATATMAVQECQGTVPERYECDVVIVGAGPAGSTAAKYASENGLDTILVEKKAEVGSPLRCAEGISKKWLSRVGIVPDRKWICADIMGMRIRTSSGSTFVSDERGDDGTGRGYVLDRHLFDKMLAEKAAATGTRIMMRTACRGVIKDKGKPIGIKADRMGHPIEIYARCIVAADGFESQVARWAGLDTTLPDKDIDTCIQYRMTNISVDKEYCEFIAGSCAPGGYIWIFPKGDGIANIGIGVQASKASAGDPKRYLDEFISKDNRLRDGQILEVVGGAVSTVPGAENVVADNLILIGDAARFINPMTGGGIHEACISGMLASQVLKKCIDSGDLSESALKEYEMLWRSEVQERFDRNYRIKTWFSETSDDVLENIVNILNEAGLKKLKMDDVLRTIKEKDPSLLSMF